LILEPVGVRWQIGSLSRAWSLWSAYVKEQNEPRMIDDKYQWLLHAMSHEERDLQAWYHASFCDQLYRLKG
jgi:hypothetical protein